MWNFLTTHGFTVLRAIPLVLLSLILVGVMCFPLEINLYPKLPPLLPLKKKDDQKTPLRKESESEPLPPSQGEKAQIPSPFEITFRITLKIEKETK
jgi:hypothetical protein